MDFNSLPALTVLSDFVTIAQCGENKIVRVIHPKASAAISLHGGHVLSYQPAEQDDLIWMSQEAVYDSAAALRGGIPICWPWFGRIAAPAHGFARTSEWSLIEHRESEQGVIISLGLNDSDATREIWPHLFSLVLNVEISDQLTVTLTMTNTDDKPWSYSGALHSYFNVGDITTTEVTGMGQSYIDGLREGQRCEGDNTLVLTDTIDRVYTAPEHDIIIKDTVLNRSISVTNHGHNSAVLWNPWAAGAKAMGDMNDDGYQTFLCVESTLHASTLEQGKQVSPGETAVLSTVIGIQ
ncbi:D-hexose-6-phosphate mutarotase [Vibrio methylphosphonaticus]|uniref:D-hexose-6-phosphate mutarotase n=1 Tax=Vibrio methylphosphonaticus TaxID=2946866 RepID=UPI00202A4D5C|nr:D-hexose-6-phosphate mutarotase [Vibrio methylphosphonaticus]MCL9774293.1 D-hexose-6-phosphate mutarotase [Vibrio methylphosphonaticus]